MIIYYYYYSCYLLFIMINFISIIINNIINKNIRIIYKTKTLYYCFYYLNIIIKHNVYDNKQCFNILFSYYHKIN